MSSTAKIAIVTGGSRGIGRSIVLNLAKQGVWPIFTYHTRADEARALVSEIEQNGGKAVALQLDTGKSSTFDAFADSVKAALAIWGAPGLDYLVNNAGISNHTPFAQITEEELDQQYTVNFKGVFLLTQKLLPLIQNGGSIVNITSGVTRFVNPNSSAYATFKGAVEVLTRYLAHDLGARNITVNSVAPGATATDFSGGVVRDNPEINQMVSSSTALGRPGLPEDIGGAVASLLTGETHWITGQRIEASGGLRL
ncbi:SDR family NAD(P)-dependent oxidoreductase [Paracoccus aminophilus]|uniref:Short-chain dehydrogenase/reductase SDR n=1 Tax=Paracoccus aminophilus JCM 7686 TaxID=1367847 RepID=S5XTX4_PARAH|nr:SDR family oxidoreductase [Paracoccus aminophilus]AGT08622.1 short-chain dehydrogenase/reductase SDR [Paracoccus aminophilus JCM 7686]